MNFAQLFLILKSRKKVFLISFLIVVSVGIIINFLLPKEYTATTSLVVNYKGIDSISGLPIQAQLMPGFMATQSQIISSHAVALRVVNTLDLASNPTVKSQFLSASKGIGRIDDWLADVLLKKLSVVPSKQTSIIEISYSGSDPEFVAVIANAFAHAYQDTSLRLKVEPSQKTSEYLNSQSLILRKAYEDARLKLSKYQQENGLTSGTDNFDVENAKLTQLANQLIVAQSQAYETASRKHNAISSGESSIDILSSPVVQNLKIQISASEKKLAELNQRLSVNHPAYQTAKVELDNLKKQLTDEIEKVSTGVTGNANIYRQQEAELKAALAAQKEKVLALNRTRGQYEVLQRDVQSAEAALNALNQRLNQTSIEGKAIETDISILNLAIPPTDISSPKMLRNIIFSVFLGILFGIGLAITIEFYDRKVRSVHDILQLTEIPVLAIVEGVKKA